MSLRSNRRPGQVTAFVEVSANNTSDDVVSRQDALRVNAARAYGFCTLKRLTIEIPNDDDSAASSQQ